ncbi:MAG: 50S ribosomal protein L11 methyltransferase [Thermoproteales archaeon]|nr:50S ribosomal protein L11 methyltransferase [Thermoproteales archaeon]
MTFNITVPYVPTPFGVIRDMLKIADLKEDEILMDLGCGDGRVLVIAAKEFKAYAIGIELRKDLVDKAINNIKRNKVEEKVFIINGSFFEISLSPANVIFLYLLTSVNEKLKPKIKAEVDKGTRIVSHDFEITGWKPYKIEEIQESGRTHKIYLYIKE